MIQQDRYFQHENGTVICVSTGYNEAGTFSFTTNMHILTDPDDFRSPPVEGWTSISKLTFDTRLDEQEVEREAVVEADLTAQTAAREKVYDEAKVLGFSEEAAQAMSGHSPE
jgi:hypothetical protein